MGDTDASHLAAVHVRRAGDDRAIPADEKKEGSTSSAFLDKDLSGWEGLIKEYWSYKDGALVGYTPTDPGFNTFLCSKKKYKDFEMKFKIRLEGRQGQQRRADPQQDRRPEDIRRGRGRRPTSAHGYWGSLYGERFGGMMKARLQGVQKAVKPTDFNDYYIKCVGKHVTIKINGVTTVDDDFAKMPEEGIIAFQLHAGFKSMEVDLQGHRVQGADDEAVNAPVSRDAERSAGRSAGRERSAPRRG